MNKKITVIELLNKIANGEDLPKKIKVKNHIFEWVDIDKGKGYHSIEGKDWIIWLEELISLDTKEDLNETVEILEDNIEEIEELPDDIDEFGWLEVKDKINELVKAVKEMRKEITNVNKNNIH